MSEPETDRQDELLKLLLRRWVVNPSLPPGFKTAVWGRIRRAETVPIDTISLAKLLLSRILDSLARPAHACAVVMLFILLGGVIGLVESRRVSARVSEDLRARYVQAISPPPDNH
jgi:hypothetical protein